MSVSFPTVHNRTNVRFIRDMNVHVFFSVGTVREPTIAPFEFALERSFAGVRSFMDFQVFGSGEGLTASCERAFERFLPGVHPDMVDQFVFRFEGEASPGTATPVTCVIRLLGTANVFLSDVHHDVRHLGEDFHAMSLVRNWYAKLIEIYTGRDPIAAVALALDVTRWLLRFLGRLSAGGNCV